ncbi:MAG: hypothetical protein O2856_07545 [Planctomycetota bacterium]|nr:hypothetical protein [Planctomycetota bacterium]
MHAARTIRIEYVPGLQGTAPTFMAGPYPASHNLRVRVDRRNTPKNGRRIAQFLQVRKVQVGGVKSHETVTKPQIPSASSQADFRQGLESYARSPLDVTVRLYDDSKVDRIGN